jgi:hypothetical protein
MEKEKDYRLFVVEEDSGKFRKVYKIPAYFTNMEEYYVTDMLTNQLYILSGWSIKEIINVGIELE